MKLHFFSDYSIIIRSMKKVKHILAIFFQSFIPNDGYYPKLLHTRFKFSLKYYIVVVSILAYVLAGVVVYQYSPKKLVGYKNSLINTLASFPKDAKITIANGILEFNQNKPLFLWVYDNKQPLFVFMVHTKDMLRSDDIPLPLFFLGEDRMLLAYQGNMKSYVYDSSLNLKITRDMVYKVIVWIESAFPSFMIGFYAILFIVLPLVFIGVSTVLILFSSLLTYIVLRIFISHIHIKKCVQAGMHGTHIPLMIIIILYIFCPNSRNIITVSTALIFVFTLVATFEMYSKEVNHSKGR